MDATRPPPLPPPALPPPLPMPATSDDAPAGLLAYRSGVSEAPPPTWRDVVAGAVLSASGLCLLVISLIFLISAVDTFRHDALGLATFLGVIGLGAGFIAFGAARQAVHRFTGETARRRAEVELRRTLDYRPEDDDGDAAETTSADP